MYFLQAKAFSSRSLTLPGNVDTRELKRAISFLMDNIGFLNTIGLFHVMFQVCFIYINSLTGSNIYFQARQMFDAYLNAGLQIIFSPSRL